MELSEFVLGYVDCALWTEEESMTEGYPALDCNIHNIEEESLVRMVEECKAFQEKAGSLLSGWTDEQAGHDFWLTRNGHGTGFWDRDFGTEESRKALSDLCKEFKECTLYVGDDGRIYIA